MSTNPHKNGTDPARGSARSDPPWRDDWRTLLIVDDEEGPRQSLRLIFEDRYNVLLASNGAEALDLARQHPVDAAVVDLRMAGMSGIEVLRRLKALDAKLEVTILTAFAALETARQALRLGATEYLTKPFDLETMRAAVARMMERRVLNRSTDANLLRFQALEREVEELRNRGERLQDRGEIFGDVLHDINKPLTVIVGMLSVLDQRLADAERVEGPAMAELRQRVKSLNRQADNVVDVVRRYLGVLRHDFRDAPTASVNQVLLDLRELLRGYPAAQSRDVSFLFLSEDATARVNGTDLLQILLNLAVNALEAAPESGRVEVAAGLPAGPLDEVLASSDPGRRVVRPPGFDPCAPTVAISVRDNGPGVPTELMNKLFETPVTTKPHGLGTGLGLTIVKKLVTLNGGALSLQTAPAAGTTVTVFLPADPGHEPASPSTPGTAT